MKLASVYALHVNHLVCRWSWNTSTVCVHVCIIHTPYLQHTLLLLHIQRVLLQRLCQLMTISMTAWDTWIGWLLVTLYVGPPTMYPPSLLPPPPLPSHTHTHMHTHTHTHTHTQVCLPDNPPCRVGLLVCILYPAQRPRGQWGRGRGAGDWREPEAT